MAHALIRALAAAALLLLAACSESPCQKVCTKLASCGVVSSESQCQSDCQKPPDNGAPCNNEDAIATCVDGASCAELTDPTSTFACPMCD